MINEKGCVIDGAGAIAVGSVHEDDGSPVSGRNIPTLKCQAIFSGQILLKEAVAHDPL
jgi:hypothetical protein